MWNILGVPTTCSMCLFDLHLVIYYYRCLHNSFLWVFIIKQINVIRSENNLVFLVILFINGK